MEKHTQQKDTIPTITIEELQLRLQQGGNNMLIDVREPSEHELSSIPGSHLIPLGELPSRLEELQGANEIYLHCRSGGRSAKALLFLQEMGFKNVYNVEGGILAWEEKIHGSQFR
ncbi:MAG TPA: rhodanese-like domain-containing protein [Chthoniobacterales bacterium]|nr:rhodanese-like domain-containing protein [Chthoniobacterales bacterium]